MEDVIQVPAGLTTEGLLGKRYMARFIDSMLLAFVGGTIFVAEAQLLRSVRPSMGLIVTTLSILPLWIGYGAILESSSWQATLGKRFMGLRVYDADGGRLNIGQAAWRNVIKDGPFIVVSLLPGGNLFALLWLIAHLIVMHRSDVYQAIHDRVAHTWVAAPEATTRLHLT